MRQGDKPLRGREVFTMSASNPRNSSCLTVSANSVLEPPMACPAVGSGPIARTLVFLPSAIKGFSLPPA